MASNRRHSDISMSWPNVRCNSTRTRFDEGVGGEVEGMQGGEVHSFISLRANSKNKGSLNRIKMRPSVLRLVDAFNLVYLDGLVYSPIVQMYGLVRPVHSAFGLS